ncbi:MAG: hypothetical protein UT24_C0016G0008 [Candidatus Woesebacteria bacterium GW2011_GWB1_39_12]|uniref:Right handed beta helix domain-containing protein n=1 Tax=Candidatus Woesebacteria bacterium GW2011_GWB1_39_12 TaxID=1618574 RepID=A0A0G0M7M7_9BACT|nr:MAG: hypothetical protein UT24_C0016G0008 [Candidatus Woesebacteria bacterium GW2011_GWB1_39_12]
MGKASKYMPAVGTFGHKWYPEDLVGVGYMTKSAKYWFVDGDRSVSGNGKSWDKAFITIQEGVTAAGAGDVVFVAEKKITDNTGDPTNYAETIIIPNGTPHLSLIGISRGLTQGGLPQIKKGSGSTALLTVRAAGCYIANLGFNGASSTGGGILLDDDNSTKTAFGTTITGCHFKNCVGTTATDGRTGGAIMWSAEGNAWQVRIIGNRFYKNVCDVLLKGTSNSVPQDVIIQDNIFSGPAASVDVNLYLAGGSGMNGVVIDNNIFQQLPAIGSGSVLRFIDATGCTGMLTRNFFGAQSSNTGTTLTWLAAGTAAKIPTTMHVAGCYGQSITAAESGEINIGANT